MPSSTPYAKPSGAVGRSKSDTALMRDKSGCITCRVRQKKCNGIAPGETDCGDCIRLNIHCLGVHHNRPDWLRNQEALKETKYRIKHHLTEYPVPRGRGPAPERPFLSFQDLIDKYSPQKYPASGSVSPNLQSDGLIRMEPESPVIYTPSQAGGYLSVQTNLYPSQNTPSPSTSYTPMPLTPSSSDGSLFMSPEVPCGYHFQPEFVNQPVGQGAAYHDAYLPELSAYPTMHASARGPYRHQHSQSLFLTSPVEPQPYQLEYLDYVRPSARRQH
ncbi:Fungal Zn(2)-Cys(6) binuclear cluster domain [Ceratobasidium sp. AG-Ba]|nr:Fungal Zn(2)-Cys(6) binuclear cluster domain [Ceratobasidium sp. AG-Ba]